MVLISVRRISWRNPKKDGLRIGMGTLFDLFYLVVSLTNVDSVVLRIKCMR